jgi:hypothetical protein
MATPPGRKSNPDPTPATDNPTTQNVFTLIVEHTESVDDMSQQVRDIVNALPGVTRCGILLPTFPERRIAVNNGSSTPHILP